MSRRKSGVREYNNMVLGWLLSQPEEVCEVLGVPASLRARLRHMSIDTLDITFPRPIAQLNFRMVGQLIDMAEQNESRKNIVLRAIKLGAHYPMIQYYVGTSRSEFLIWQDLMEVSRKTRGRINLLDEKEEAHVTQAWEDPDNHREDELETLCIIAEVTHTSLDRIWSFLMPISRPGRKRPSHRL